jgi:hypothetical protein
MQTLEWFKARVSKRIFRDDSGCPCYHCKYIAQNGIIVESEEHAEYMYWTQNEFFNDDGTILNYRDTLKTTP